LSPQDIKTNMPNAEDYLINCIKYHQAILRWVNWFCWFTCTCCPYGLDRHKF
jgi:hypothetical protein